MSESNAYSYDINGAKEYWAAKLTGIKNETEIPTSGLRGLRNKKAEYNINLTGTVKELLLKLGQGSEALIYTALLSAVKVFIMKCTGSQDITIGSPAYKDEKITPATDVFNRFILLRDFLRPEMTFKELLLEVRKTVFDGYKHQAFPLGKLSGLMDIDAAETGLLRVILMLDSIHLPLKENDLDALSNDIAICFSFKDNVLAGKITYNSSVYDEVFIESFSSGCANILEQALKNLNTRLCELSAVNEEEKTKLLSEFNSTSSSPEKRSYSTPAVRGAGAQESPGHCSLCI